MFGILFIYWIWKSFTNLAVEYNKNKWSYFFIGIGSYYGINFLSALIYVFLMGFINGFDSVANGDYDNTGYNILFMIFGGLGCFGVFKFLENKLEKEHESIEKEGIDSIGLIEED